MSVIIAAYNAEATLGEQLEALARQNTAFAWEVLVCDNGSSDGTADLVWRWQSRLPHLVLVDASDRRGASAARNIGSSVARAPLLAFCDADDVVADDWLQSLHDALGIWALVGGAGEATRLGSARHASVSWSVDAVITKPYWPQFSAAASSNLGVRTDVFRRVGGFDEELRTGEDIDLCWRVQLAGESFARCDGAVVHIRKRTGLVPVFRQAFAYAVGDLQLRRKHAEAIAAYQRSLVADPAVGSPAEPGDSGKRRGLWSRARRIFRPDGRADAAWRLGAWFGTHFGSPRSRLRA